MTQHHPTNSSPSQTPADTKKSRWGIGIALLYGSFVLFMTSIVIYVSTVDFELVEDDYYAQQIDYQESIDALERGQALKDRPLLVYDSSLAQVALVFSRAQTEDISGGAIEFMKPSSKSADTTIQIPPAPTQGVIVPASALESGLWNVTVRWTMNDKLYMIEYPLFLD